MKPPAIILAILSIFGLFFSGQWDKAEAVPSFARQTGMECTSCHTIFPELTPFGRSFKLNGYVFSNGTKKYPPFSGMLQVSYTEAKGLDNRIDPFDDSPKARINLPQEASLYYAGRIVDRLGSFIQVTYDGIGNDIALDMTDIRYASHTAFGRHTLSYGLTINNSPTLEDIWNTTPVWSFPYAASAVALTPAAGPVIQDRLSQQVGGIGAYVLFDDLIYAAGAVYRTNKRGLTRPLSAGTAVDTVVDNTVPYWRIALQHTWAKHSFAIGAYGLTADIFPGEDTNGPTDRFRDTAMDAQYQYISKEHIFNVAGTWIHEKQDWDAGFPLGNTSNSSDSLDTVKINAGYYYRASFGTLGGIIGYFSTTGDADSLLYAPAPLNGSGSGSPDSNGFIFEADYLPWPKTKIAVQYTAYDKFNGAHSNYDGFGRNASDNNTFYLLAWQLF